MINLTTKCGNSETLLTALTFILFVAPSILLGQIEEFPQATNGADARVSVLESSVSSNGTQSGWGQQPQDDPFVIQQDLIQANAAIANPPQPTQQSIAPTLAGSNGLAEPQELEEPQILLRGPLHEAFADAHQADPRPNPIISAFPPEAINEVPPEFKPEGSNVEWIPGYWAWDESQNDFIWISGVWRDVPPNQRWVPGYWEQAENGHRWIAGFWTALETQELSYLPTPPANLDRGPSVAAPSDDYFYCPGNWEYQNSTFVWRTGHWQPRVANWIWIPARYIWTPRGCIYRPGYWDREFDVRGTLFAPVHFQPQQYLATDFRFQPNHCVNTGADFFVHLFVRPNCNHYFYGDWYGQNFVNTGFRPWIQPRSHVRNYDPLLAHYNCSRYRQGGQLFINWVSSQHLHYHRNHAHRPRNTLQAQVNFTRSNRNDRYQDFIRRANLASRFDDVIRERGNGRQAVPRSNRSRRVGDPNFNRSYVKTDRRDRDQHDINSRLHRETRSTRKSSEQRSRNSGRSGNRVVQETTSGQRAGSNQQDRRSNTDRNKQVVDRNVANPGGKRSTRDQPSSGARQRRETGNQGIARRNPNDLPKTQLPQARGRSDRDNANGLTRAQIEKAQRDQEKAIRKRELEQKIAAAKQESEIRRQQRENARALSERQRQQKLNQTRQRIAQEKQARQSSRNPDSARSKARSAESRAGSTTLRNQQRAGVEQNRNRPTQPQLQPRGQSQRQPQRQPSTSRAGVPQQRTPRGSSLQSPTTRQRAGASQQSREIAKQQRDEQNRMAAERAKQMSQQRAAQARESSRQRELQRQAERAAKAQADAQRRRDLASRIAREKSQRDAERLATQQRARQKAQADAQRRARERAQKEAQRRSADQARRAASAAQKRQREQEQAARRAKRKKK